MSSGFAPGVSKKSVTRIRLTSCQTRPASHNLVEMQDRRTAWEVTIFRGWHHSRLHALKVSYSRKFWWKMRRFENKHLGSLLYNYISAMSPFSSPISFGDVPRTHTKPAHTQTIESSVDNVTSIVSQY